MSSVQRQASSGSDGSAVDDKKRKKMLSNRESARRSRMKKQNTAYNEVEALEQCPEGQEKELTDRLRYLESIEQTIVEFSGVFDENFGNMAEMHHDSLLNPWQLPTQLSRSRPLLADMFLDWPLIHRFGPLIVAAFVFLGQLVHVLGVSL
ncbi:hypothetical protein M0R45_027759 [Rubus argutus]|uniref:BZIP domain-containing protein n=1 Tax=Rubus argutus TaxID=59490 RepID=A0AAW1X3W8_RUBAR